jgi:hypothetical protein
LESLGIGISQDQRSDPTHLRMLRACRERPCCRPN